MHARSLNAKRSVKKIPAFIAQYNIRIQDYEAREYTSFNDFFTRKARPVARPADMSGDALIAVADAKLTVYTIDDALAIPVKNAVYTVGELTGCSNSSSAYGGGYCLVFRLTVDDCHRYLFPDDGTVIETTHLPGRLHTVSPLSEKRHRVFVENQREVSRMALLHLGDAVQIEVGAIQVGKIHNHAIPSFHKGEEKGFFSFGGSTVILLLEKNRVRMDADILTSSENGVETQIRMGERIGDIVKCLNV